MTQKKTGGFRTNPNDGRVKMSQSNEQRKLCTPTNSVLFYSSSPYKIYFHISTMHVIRMPEGREPVCMAADDKPEPALDR